VMYGAGDTRYHGSDCAIPLALSLHNQAIARVSEHLKINVGSRKVVSWVNLEFNMQSFYDPKLRALPNHGCVSVPSAKSFPVFELSSSSRYESLKGFFFVT
jgi:hypothetical protein